MSAPPLIRFNDVAAAYSEQRAEIDGAMQRVLARGDFINGKEVPEFEAAFAKACDAAYCVGCANGTAALHLALAAAGVSPGSEVITTAMTFIATAEAIGHAGAKVVFADVDRDTLNLTRSTVEAAITPNTSAVLFVHLHGNPSGIEEIAQLCRERGLRLIEDCAQAHGASIGNPPRRVGTFGDVGAFSFFPGKNIGAFGDAGALVTNSHEIADKARQLANHGREEKYLHLVPGYNYRLDTLQAAVLLAKLPSLPHQVERRNEICARYERQLAGVADLRFQRMTAPGTHARHLFVVLTKDRDAFQQHLKRANIQTGIHYPVALHEQPAYKSLGYSADSMPVAEEIARTTLSLPLYPQLPVDQVDAVSAQIRKFFKK